MAMKLLKYGIGIFMPESPEGFDMNRFASYDAFSYAVPPGEDAGEIAVPALIGKASAKLAVGAGAKVRFVEKAEGDRDAAIDIEIGEGASVTYVSRASASVEFVRRTARLAKGAKLAWIDETSAPDFARASFLTRLEGEGAEVEATSLLRGDGRKRFDVFHEIVHAAPRTVSNLRVGSVLSGGAKAIVRGLVRVEKGAHGCVSRQKEETLLLSDTAEIDAVPMLEIGNQDVRCAHAATVGRLDAEKLFYLMSRGIDRASAEAMLVDAFMEPYLAKIS